MDTATFETRPNAAKGFVIGIASLASIMVGTSMLYGLSSAGSQEDLLTAMEPDLRAIAKHIENRDMFLLLAATKGR